jgi:uncharacterized metal-binding protein
VSDCSCNGSSDEAKSGDSCSCGGGPVLMFPCSGGSNVGQIANAAAVELDRRRQARIYCLAGVAAHISGMVDSAKSASGVIAIDGCPVVCAKIALEHAGIQIDQAIIVTELGIEKNHQFTWEFEEVEKVISAVQHPAVTP